MAPPDPPTPENGPITMEFDETCKKSLQIYGSGSIFGVPRPPEAIPGRNGDKFRTREGPRDPPDPETWSDYNGI